MDSILRFSGAVERDPAIHSWVDKQATEFRVMARKWFARMRECGGDVRELMHDGFPYVCVEEAPFAYVNVFTAHMNVGFVYGALLPDPAGLLEGTGRLGRHVKVRPGAEPDPEQMNALIDHAYRDIKKRLQAG
jgi:hypothetical protein